MGGELTPRSGETAAHARLKRLALVWAQAQSYQACAMEVRLPRSRFRADVAAYRYERGEERTAVFECKQSLPDLRRDNCCLVADRARWQTLQRRRETLERNLRVHFPGDRCGEALFPEYDRYDFSHHRTHTRVLREIERLQLRISLCAKFETLMRYHCANEFFLVVSQELQSACVTPPGWGVLVEEGDHLLIAKRPRWQHNTAATRAEFLRRVAIAGTRAVNRVNGLGNFRAYEATPAEALADLLL